MPNLNNPPGGAGGQVIQWLISAVKILQSRMAAVQSILTPTISLQTGTAYTLRPSDLYKVVEFNSATNATVTIPTGLGPNFQVTVRQLGTGSVIAAAGAGVTLVNASSLTKTKARYSAFTISGTTTAETYVTQGDML